MLFWLDICKLDKQTQSVSDLFKPNGCRTRKGRYKQFNIVCNRQSCNNPGKHWVYSLLDKALALIMKTLGAKVKIGDGYEIQVWVVRDRAAGVPSSRRVPLRSHWVVLSFKWGRAYAIGGPAALRLLAERVQRSQCFDPSTCRWLHLLDLRGQSDARWYPARQRWGR